MDLRLIYSIILSILPISELRGGLPLAIIYAKENNIPIAAIFFLIILVNCAAVFIAFFFLDKLNQIFMRNKIYRRVFDAYLRRLQKKVDKFEKRYSALGFIALTLFVAVPLPITGAWSACLIAWLLELDRKRSIISIIAGIMIAGLFVLFGTLGFLGFFS